jgi:hypothetical protein
MDAIRMYNAGLKSTLSNNAKHNIQTHANVLGMFFAMFILQKSAKIKQYVAIF